MPTDPQPESRERFEKWAKDRGYVISSGGPYGLSFDRLWEVWQAAERSMAERAAQLDKEVERLNDILHQDRSGLAEALVNAKKLAESRMWIVDGRGSYEWDDERYRREAGWALKEIVEHCRIALETSGNLAHAECCGRGRALSSTPEVRKEGEA